MIKMIKRVGEMNTIPNYYGVAWRDYNSQVVVCAPFGLHLVFGLARSVWVELRFWFTPLSSIDVIRYTANAEGYKRGVARGSRTEFERGYREGMAAFKAEVLRDFGL